MSDIDDSSIISELRYDGTEFGKMAAARIADLKDSIAELEALNAELAQALRTVMGRTPAEQTIFERAFFAAARRHDVSDELKQYLTNAMHAGWAALAKVEQS